MCSLSVPPPTPLPCKILEASCVVPRTFFSYNYLTFDFIKCVFLSFLWVLLLFSNITLMNVRCIHFISFIFISSHTFQSWVYVFTFLSLFEPFLWIFAIDKTLALYFPSKYTLVAFKKSLYSKIYMTSFLSFKYLIMSIVFFASTSMSIPCTTLWYFQLVIYLSNDISKNPCPEPHFQNNFFNFMSWNLNSLAKDNFHRVSLIEAQHSFFNYDLISVSKTSLNDSVELPEPLLDEYTFLPANNPTNTRRGGVGLFYRNSLPVVVRNDLSSDESIVVELKFGRKIIFFTVLYRSPAFNHNSLEFQAFLSNFKTYI